MIIKDVQLVHTAFAKTDLIGDAKPKVIFLGRSNVGKSSLINSLLNRKNLARTSSTPGKTVSINYYLVNDSFYFVDLPGYGYAKISRVEKQRVNDLMFRFFKTTPRSALVVLLIDSRRGFLDSDLEVLAKILDTDSKILTVLTKSDKISSSQLATLERKYQKQFELFVVPFSVKSFGDREKIWRYIGDALAGFSTGSHTGVESEGKNE